MYLSQFEIPLKKISQIKRWKVTKLLSPEKDGESPKVDTRVKSIIIEAGTLSEAKKQSVMALGMKAGDYYQIEVVEQISPTYVEVVPITKEKKKPQKGRARGEFKTVMTPEGPKDIIMPTEVAVPTVNKSVKPLTRKPSMALPAAKSVAKISKLDKILNVSVEEVVELAKNIFKEKPEGTLADVVDFLLKQGKELFSIEKAIQEAFELSEVLKGASMYPMHENSGTFGIAPNFYATPQGRYKAEAGVEGPSEEERKRIKFKSISKKDKELKKLPKERLLKRDELYK